MLSKLKETWAALSGANRRARLAAEQEKAALRIAEMLQLLDEAKRSVGGIFGQYDPELKAWLLALIETCRRQKLEREKLAEAAYATMTSHHGKILLAYLLQEIFYSISHQPGITPEDTACNEGQRAMVKHLLDLMNEYVDPPTVPEVEKQHV